MSMDADNPRGGKRRGNCPATAQPQEAGQARELPDAPPNSLPTWSECAMRVDNSDFIAKRVTEGGYGAGPDSLLASALHQFIYEYDDADPCRSAWFMHRLEQVLKEFAAAQAAPSVPDGHPIEKITVETAMRRDWIAAVNAAYVTSKGAGDAVLTMKLLDIHWFLNGGKYRREKLIPLAFSCAKRAADPSSEFAACRQFCGNTSTCITAAAPSAPSLYERQTAGSSPSIYRGQTAPPAPAVSADAGESERDRTIRQAVVYHDGQWPQELYSGVMFFNGERITENQFKNAIAAQSKDQP